MKTRSTAPALYYWSQTQDAAEKLATWAYCNLIKPESPHAKNYPLEGASCQWLADGSWGIVLPEQKTALPTKGAAESIEVGQPLNEVQESVRIRLQLEEIAVDLRKASDFSKCYYSTGMIADDLSKAISKANKLLARVVATSCKRSAEMLWSTTLQAVGELVNLSARADTLPLLQAIACKQTVWPVSIRKAKPNNWP